VLDPLLYSNQLYAKEIVTNLDLARVSRRRFYSVGRSLYWRTTRRWQTAVSSFLPLTAQAAHEAWSSMSLRLPRPLTPRCIRGLTCTP